MGCGRGVSWDLGVKRRDQVGGGAFPEAQSVGWMQGRGPDRSHLLQANV
jgi:hypothetical protein